MNKTNSIKLWNKLNIHHLFYFFLTCLCASLK